MVRWLGEWFATGVVKNGKPRAPGGTTSRAVERHDRVEKQPRSGGVAATGTARDGYGDGSGDSDGDGYGKEDIIA